ncbi:MAG TPA: aromatic ring-hydroxylating dioxygenase subunit alpha [bacterium]|nr:aromatic ring-hydroxylating dioxygenase subunit alpha [bacterium]
MQTDVLQTKRPPTFAEASTRRQKARAAGLVPDHWYIVARANELRPGDMKEIVFSKQSIALYRGQDGEYRAIENRCAHRSLKLTTGVVEGCNLICQYHGWMYNGDGRLIGVKHDRFGHELLNLRIRSYPVAVSDGLVWMFPGDSKKANQTPIPALPEMGSGSGWSHYVREYRWQCHHSMVIDNLCDLSHGYLHRRTRPFGYDARLTRYQSGADDVTIEYQVRIGDSKLMNALFDRRQMPSGSLLLKCDYPYFWSWTDDYIKIFVSFIPVDERTTHFFMVGLVRPMNFPYTGWKLPKWAMEAVVRYLSPLELDKIMKEDQAALSWEIDAYERHWNEPAIELNPVVNAVQDLIIGKWTAYMKSEA